MYVNFGVFLTLYIIFNKTLNYYFLVLCLSNFSDLKYKNFNLKLSKICLIIRPFNIKKKQIITLIKY